MEYNFRKHLLILIGLPFVLVMLVIGRQEIKAQVKVLQ